MKTNYIEVEGNGWPHPDKGHNPVPDNAKNLHPPKLDGINISNSVPSTGTEPPASTGGIEIK